MTDAEREIVRAENTKPVDKRRCPLCGYTKADQDIHMDHRLCEQVGGINFSNPTHPAPEGATE